MALTPAEILDHRSRIGATMTIDQLIDAASIARFTAAAGVTSSRLAHWAFFNEAAPDDALGDDGHPRRGGFLPAIDQLPRRMFAASAMVFGAPLMPGRDAAMTLRIASLQHKQGRTGDLAFVEVERIVVQSGETCVTERQTLVYKPAARTAPLASVNRQPAVDDASWRPGTANLFRFSAATFNGHRIHYDRAYAVDVEGYPDLVVHGPFIAARLADLAARRGPLATFEFRAQAPCFVDRAIRLAETAAGTFEAIRDDGVVAMTAKAGYR